MCVEINSTIHKATGSLVTGHSQKSCQQEPPPEAIPSLMASQLEQWNSTSQIMERLGTVRPTAL